MEHLNPLPVLCLSIFTTNTWEALTITTSCVRGYYSVRMKGRKLYKYIWWFVFEVAVTNSYILWKHEHTSTSLKDFRASLAKELIGDFQNRKRRGRPSMSASSTFCSDHFPVQEEKRSRCYYCFHKKSHRRRDTPWFCKTCNKYLCHNGKHDDCFLKYHQTIYN